MRLQPRMPRPRSIAAVAMSLGLGGVATLALVTDASAHANIVNGLSTCTNGTYSITWTVHNDWNLVDTAQTEAHGHGGDRSRSRHTRLQTHVGSYPLVRRRQGVGLTTRSPQPSASLRR